MSFWRPRELVRPRSEALILVPAALLVMVALSFFVLFSYRQAVASMLASRGARADQLAREIASRVGRASWPQPEVLRGWASEAWAVALLDESQVPIVVVGDLAPHPVRRDSGRGGPEAGTPAPDAPWTLPAGVVDDVVSARAPITGGTRGFVRVDLAAPDAVRSARALRFLLPTVVVVDVALVALLLVYLRLLVGRFDAVVARARRASGSLEGGDDLLVLIRALDRALASPQADSDGELAAVGRAVSRGLEGGVLLLDDAGNVIAASIAAASLLGISQPDKRQPLSAVLAQHPQLVSILDDAVSGRREVRREACTIETPAGVRALGLTANPLRREGGGRTGLMVLFADLTAERRRAEQARLADRLAHVGALAAGVAHEMRNSVATLRGYLDLASRAGTAARDEHLAELRLETDHLERVVEDFLRFARPGSVRPEAVDLAALLRRAAADPSLAPTPIEVRIEPESAPPNLRTLIGDPNLLLHALRNLLRNAVEAQRRGGDAEATVIARLTVREEEAVIEIDDRGAGLGNEDPATLFDPFVSGRADGVGLGLAITNRVVLLHGGEIQLRPRAGGGASARIVMPRLGAGKVVTDRNNPAAVSPQASAPKNDPMH